MTENGSKIDFDDSTSKSGIHGPEPVKFLKSGTGLDQILEI